MEGPPVLIGFMGAGKTTAARALDPAAVDADEVLEERLGMPIERFFAEHGEAVFRAEEERVVLELLERAGAPVALGGGAVLSERVRAALRDRDVVWIDVDADTAWGRVNGSPRPLARDREAFGALLVAREPLYAEVADVVVVPGGDVAAALDWARRRPGGTRVLWAAGASGQHPVVVGRGLLRSGWWPLEGRRFTVTDEHVAPLHAAGHDPVLALPAGEEHKTLAAAERVWRWLADRGATRADHVAALGGGVVGDLAGFCAATYQRGIAVVQVPTTLVAQVDSAYGGKTGIDLPEAKNYVGAYHPPAAVVLDPDALETLPPVELAAGYAEVVKTALIAGGALWERVRAGAVADEETILACALTKLRVVAADERDAGPRQVLNLGHTVGHAIEAATGYRRYRHGEAVALGLLAALRLSGQPELRAEVVGLLAAHGLPTRLQDADVDAVLAAVRRDKKRVGEGPVPFVLVAAPGDVRHGQPVSDPDLRAAVEELCR